MKKRINDKSLNKLADCYIAMGKLSIEGTKIMIKITENGNKMKTLREKFKTEKEFEVKKDWFLLFCSTFETGKEFFSKLDRKMHFQRKAEKELKNPPLNIKEYKGVKIEALKDLIQLAAKHLNIPIPANTASYLAIKTIQKTKHVGKKLTGNIMARALLTENVDNTIKRFDDRKNLIENLINNLSQKIISS